MTFGIVIFPGSNCDEDTAYVLEQILKQKVIRLWHKSQYLQNADFIILPGGFSYGDYLRSGAIARCSPIMKALIPFAQAGGYVMGICNGFQILTEARLLPGSFLHNQRCQFICRNVYLKTITNNSLITAKIDTKQVLKIPIAHGEGQFFADAATLQSLNDHDQILFRYCDKEGRVLPAANPNGSLENIAGICNKRRNVFGMMPHPERAADSLLANEDGLQIFRSIISRYNAHAALGC